MAEKGFWQGKKVFLTGVNGFIGGNLAKALLDAGAEVFGLIRNLNEESFLYFEGLHHRMTLIEGDLTDKELLTRVISEEGISCVFHLGAQVEVGVGLKNPYLTFETNVRGTYSLMEAIRTGASEGQIEAVVIASTDKAYGAYPKEEMPYQEDYPLKPEYPYDVSKACADMIARSYSSDAYKMPVIITRFCNIYGPGQLNFSAIIPDSIRSALGYTTFEPRGDGTQMRDFIFAEDVAGLYLRLGQELAEQPSKMSGQVFNAGTNSAVTMREVLEKVYRLIGADKALAEVIAKFDGKKTFGEIDAQFMDFKKVEQFCGWRPEHDLDAGLEKTIAWFKRFLAHKYGDS